MNKIGLSLMDPPGFKYSNFACIEIFVSILGKSKQTIGVFPIVVNNGYSFKYEIYLSGTFINVI